MRARRTKPQAAYDQENTEAAAIILADPARYPGALQEWAALWRKKNAAAQKVVLESRSATRITPAIGIQKGTSNNGEQHQLFPA